MPTTRSRPDARRSEFESLSGYLSTIRRYPPLEREAERALATRVRKGEAKARRLLVLHNLSLVIAVSRKYMGRGIRLDDLVQEGNVGLMKAVEHFDPKRGTRFSTYAVWWIRAYVHKLARDGRTTVRQPAPVPGEEQNRIPFRDVSLEETFDEDGELSHMDRLVSDAPGPDEEYGAAEHSQEVQDALGKVKKRIGPLGWQIVHERFTQDKPRTLEEIGHKFGVSRERVRQVEKSTKVFLKRYLAPFAA